MQLYRMDILHIEINKLYKEVKLFDKEEVNKIYLKAKAAIYVHYMSKYVRDIEIEDLYSVYKSKKIDEVNDKSTLLILISETLVARIVKETTNYSETERVARIKKNLLVYIIVPYIETTINEMLQEAKNK